MATKQATIDYILDNIEDDSGSIRARKMFGEYAIYFEDKVVAFVCDDQLFIKPTIAGRMHIGDVVEAPPYPGAKPFFLISGDRWDDRDWLTQLIKITAAELPITKKKIKKK